MFVFAFSYVCMYVCMYNIGLFKLVDTYGQGSPLRSASPLP